MKIQSLAVIFAIIILPITIILSFFIQKEVDTIALQTSYDTKLIDSTHDALAAFEINTTNEDLSSVADSLRSIIEASTNIFFNTLATNLGMSNASKSSVQAYVPAILYTLYDGYYIYSPTRVPTVATTDNDEEVICVGDDGVKWFSGDGTRGCYKINSGETTAFNSLGSSYKYEFGQMLYLNKDGTYSTKIKNSTPPADSDTAYKEDYVLKSYMPYAVRYKTSGGGTEKACDISVNYTLDNYITVEGTVDDIYFAKTGYLISDGTVTSATADGDDLIKYNENDIEEMCLSGKYNLSVTIKPRMENGSVVPNPITINYSKVPTGVDDEGNTTYMSYADMKARLKKIQEDNANSTDAGIVGEIQELQVKIANMASIAYYAKSQSFSNWIYDNLGAIRVCDIDPEFANYNTIDNYTTTSGTDLFVNFLTDESIIFNRTTNPELLDSTFTSHKLNVIRNSIQYNLNLALSAYNRMAGGINVQMPAIDENEWLNILTKVSIVSFLQGLNCGLKTYNNYAIVSSTNNELTVIPSEIYYTYADTFNIAETASLIPSDISGGSSNADILYHRIDCDKLLDTRGEYISFRSKEVKYDKIYDKNLGTSGKYKYDHRNNADYKCIVSSNYLKDIDSAHNQGYNDNILISLLSDNKKKAYYVAVGKERQEIYKTNALSNSEGYETIYVAPSRKYDLITGADRYADANGIYGTGTDTLRFGDGDTTLTIPLDKASSRALSEIKAVEITFRDVRAAEERIESVRFDVDIAGNATRSVSLVRQVDPKTVTIPVHSDNSGNLSTITFTKRDLEHAVKLNVLCVRVIYE